MAIGFIVVGVIAGVLGLSGLVLWGIYNSLISKRNKVRQAFSGVHVQLKRRANLIPNLVETVKGYAKHEREILERVTRLRREFLSINPDDHAKVIAQDNILTQALRQVFAVVENYPDLKASQNFLRLQESLEETEDQIAAARRIYNANVNVYNTSIQQFPSNLVANHFKFQREDFFQAKEVDQQLPRVSFA